MMAEQSRFKKKVHFGGTLPPSEPALGWRCRAFVLPRAWGLGHRGVLGEMGGRRVLGVSENRLGFWCLRLTIEGYLHSSVLCFPRRGKVKVAVTCCRTWAWRFC